MLQGNLEPDLDSVSLRILRLRYPLAVLHIEPMAHNLVAVLAPVDANTGGVGSHLQGGRVRAREAGRLGDDQGV